VDFDLLDDEAFGVFKTAGASFSMFFGWARLGMLEIGPPELYGFSLRKIVKVALVA
jgi:hypothetical protein